MADNLKVLKQNLDNAIDPNAGIGQILAQDHNDVITEFINKSGKYAGLTYKAVSDGANGVIPIGTFSWNGNAMNQTGTFILSLSTKTTDLNIVTPLFDNLIQDDLIKFKDFVGRSVLLKYKSHTIGQDTSNNDIVLLSVESLPGNVNYTYQSSENEPCVLDFYPKSSSGKEYSIDIIANQLKFYEDGTEIISKDLSIYLDDTNLARLVSGVVSNGILTVTRDDNTTFDIDLTSISSVVNFSDIDGNIFYASDTDKRSGYYDNINKVYYPDIKQIAGSSNQFAYDTSNILNPTSFIPDFYYNLTPKKGALNITNNGGAGGGVNSRVYYTWGIPKIPPYDFSFILNIKHLNNSTNNYEMLEVVILVEKVTISGGVTTWGEVKVDYLVEPKYNEWTFVFADDNSGNLLIGVYTQDYIQYSDYVYASMTDFKIRSSSSKVNPLDYYNDIYSFMYNKYQDNLASYRIRKTISQSEVYGINRGLSVLDENGALIKTTDEIQIGSDLEFNNSDNELNTKKEYGTFTPIIQGHRSGGLTYTNTSSVGNYFKQGNIVYFDINISGINTTGTPGANVVIEINNLPFFGKVAGTRCLSRLIVLTGFSFTSNLVEIQPYINKGTSRILFVYSNGSTPYSMPNTALREVNITNGVIQLCGSYNITN